MNEARDNLRRIAADNAQRLMAERVRQLEQAFVAAHTKLVDHAIQNGATSRHNVYLAGDGVRIITYGTAH